MVTPFEIHVPPQELDDRSTIGAQHEVEGALALGDVVAGEGNEQREPRIGEGAHGGTMRRGAGALKR